MLVDTRLTRSLLMVGPNSKRWILSGRNRESHTEESPLPTACSAPQCSTGSPPSQICHISLKGHALASMLGSLATEGSGFSLPEHDCERSHSASLPPASGAFPPASGTFPPPFQKKRKRGSFAWPEEVLQGSCRGTSLTKWALTNPFHRADPFWSPSSCACPYRGT